MAESPGDHELDHDMTTFADEAKDQHLQQLRHWQSVVQCSSCSNVDFEFSINLF